MGGTPHPMGYGVTPPTHQGLVTPITAYGDGPTRPWGHLHSLWLTPTRPWGTPSQPMGEAHQALGGPHTPMGGHPTGPGGTHLPSPPHPPSLVPLLQ